MSKDFFHRQSVIKYSAKSDKMKQNWTNPGIFDIWICINLDNYCQKLIFRESTGHSSVSIKF